MVSHRQALHHSLQSNCALLLVHHQICVSGVLQGLAEGLNFARLVGLDYEKLFSAIKNGAAQSWQMDNRSKTMWNDKFEFGFMNKWMKKDLNIAINVAKKTGVKLDNTKKILKNYEKLIKLGYKNFDTSSLIKLLNEN